MGEAVMKNDTFSYEEGEFSPIRRESVTHMITEQIKKMIRDGSIKPGEKLPSQDKLQKMFGVSKPALREAMTGLTMLGYIEPQVGSGYYVRDMENFETISYDTINEMFSSEDISTIFEARLLFEAAAGYLAAKRATDEEIKALYDFLDETENQLENEKTGDVYDKGIQFHAMVIDCCHNPVISEIEKKFLDEFKSRGNRIYGTQDVHNFDASWHRKIVDSIAAHDTKQTYESIIRDLYCYLEKI